jgi:hypothetical protein
VYKEIFYKKVGRRYVPVYEYDQTLMDSFPKGSHLVICYPGGQSRRFGIDPAYAPMIAAGRVAEDAMHTAIRDAAQMHRSETEGLILTDEQQAAWEKFVEVMGDRGRYVQYKSVHAIAEAGLKALEEEADKLMKHESVKHAYEQFLLVCKLTKENA